MSAYYWRCSIICYFYEMKQALFVACILIVVATTISGCKLERRHYQKNGRHGYLLSRKYQGHWYHPRYKKKYRKSSRRIINNWDRGFR